MRTNKVLLMLALLVLPISSSAVSDNDDAILLKRKDTSGSNEQKNGTTISIECFLVRNSSLLEIHANEYRPFTVIALENICTGEITQSVISLSPSTTYVVIPSFGDYYLSIVLRDGTVYYGEFTI